MADEKTVEINFFGGAYQSRSLNENAQVCQNLYPVIDQQGGKSVMTLQGTPGMKKFANVNYGTTVPPSEQGVGMRCLAYGPNYNLSSEIIGEELYGVYGNRFFVLNYYPGGEIPTVFASIVGNIIESSDTGPMQMAVGALRPGTNAPNVVMVDGIYGYYYGGTFFTRITDAAFPHPTSVTYQDGYFIVTEKGTSNFFISALDNPSQWDALEFASAEGNPDVSIRIISVNRDLWIFGTHSTEIFLNTGNADFPFERMSGGFINIGCGAANSVATDRGVICFLDDCYQVRMTQGYQAIVASTPQLDYQIGLLSKKDDATAIMFTMEGHTFYELTFPSANKTYVYDLSTNFWHTRSSGMSGGRHSVSAYVFCWGRNIVGCYNDNNLYELDYDSYQDEDGAGSYATNKAIRVSQPVHKERKNIFFHSLEVEFETGTREYTTDGVLQGQTTDATAILQWSDNGAKTWSNEHYTSFGKIGEYKKRAIWRRLGQSRSRIFKLSIVQPIKRVLLGAYLNGSLGSS